MRVFGEMEERGLPGPHIGKERLGLKKRNGDFELLGQSRGVLGVPQLERIHDVALHPEGCLAPFVHEGDHRPLGEEGQKRGAQTKQTKRSRKGVRNSRPMRTSTPMISAACSSSRAAAGST